MAGNGARGFRVPLRLQIGGLFALLLGALALALGLASDRGARQLVDETAATAFAASADLVLQDLHRLEQTARGAAEGLALSPLNRATGLSERRTNLDLLATVLWAVPGVNAAYLGWPDGEFLLLRPVDTDAAAFAPPPGATWLAQWVGRGGVRFDFLDAGMALIESRPDVAFDFDPRTRSWFLEANADAGTVVTDPYIFFTTRDPGITAARRADSGAVAGVDVTLWDLSARLPEGQPVPSAASAVIDTGGKVLAYSRVEQLQELLAAASGGGGDLVVLPAAGDLGAPGIAALAARYARDRLPFFGRLEAGGQEYLGTIAPLEWRDTAFVMVAPMAELTAGPSEIRTRLLQVFGIALLIGVPAVWFLARLVAHPVETFAREVEAVAQLDFGTPQRSPSRVAELDDLDQAIGTMRANLGSFAALCRGIFESDDVQAMLATTLDRLMTASGAERGGIWLADDAGRMLEPMVLQGVRAGNAPSVPLDHRGSAAARAARAGEAGIIRSVTDDPDLLSDAVPDEGALAVLGLPLRSRRGELKGVVVLARREGEEAPFQPAAVALGQTVARLLVLAIDRRRLIAEQRASLERMRLLDTAVSRLNDIVVITDATDIDAPDGPRLLFVNEAFTRQTGYLAEEVLGRTPRILQGPRTSRKELDRIRAALTEGVPVHSELVNYTRAGAEIWLDIDIVPLKDDGGRPTHWVAVERDITARKQAEESVRISQERFLLLARATNDVIWDWDLDTGGIWWNDRLTPVFGHEPQADGTMPDALLALVEGADRDRVSSRLEAAIAGRQAGWLDEYRLRRADGGIASVVERGFTIRDAGGRVRRLLGSMTDVTELREMDERLRQSQKLEAIGQLTGGLAHDFNNILTVITGSVELLQDVLADREDLLRLLEMTKAAAERGAGVTHQLLAFARRQSLNPEPLQVQELVAAMEVYLRPSLGERIAIEISAEEGLWLAFADPAQLQNALLNLCLNARDAMPDGGAIRIALVNCRRDAGTGRDDETGPGEYVQITVADTGIGMAPDQVARAFEPFFTTKAVGKGSGLGLSMVYGFARQSGGQVEIRSAPGAGTSVILYLPRTMEPAGHAEPGPTSAPVEGGREHVLLVEDDELVRAHVAAQLAGLGYGVSQAASAAEALAMVRGGTSFDLLFTDMVMPGGMNGFALAQEVRRLRPGLPILFTSGYTDQTISPPEDLAGEARILSKPYRRAELAARLRAAIDRAPAS